MDLHLLEGNWLIYGDFNHTEFVEDSVGPTPFYMDPSKEHGTTFWINLILLITDWLQF